MAENYKNDIINAMKKAYEESGYYEAYQVYSKLHLPYPTDNIKSMVEAAEQTFVAKSEQVSDEAHAKVCKTDT